MPRTTDPDLISVLRRPDGLYAYVVRRREIFQSPGELEEVDLSTLDPCVERIVPLRDLPHSPRSPLLSALNSWDALGEVRKLDAGVLFHLVNVLLHSLPEEDIGSRPLTFEPAPPTFRPTAANPRAYKGTKDRPPKRGQPRGMDLRPHLSNSRDVNALMLRLAPFREEAGRRLKKADILSHLPSSRARDVYLSCLHREDDRSLFSLPALFRRGLLFWRRGEPWTSVGRLLGLYRTLGLETNAPLRRCVERFLAPGPAEGVDLLLDAPPERRVAFAELLMEADLHAHPPGIGDVLRRANEANPDRGYRHRMFALLETVKKGGSAEYLVSGFELAGNRDYEFQAVTTKAEAPVDAIRSIGDGYLSLYLWRDCAAQPGMAEVLTEYPWRRLPQEARSGLLNLLTGNPPEKWAVLREWTPTLFGMVDDAPPRYKSKALRHLNRLVWYWDDPGELAWSIFVYEKVLQRICRPPFLEDGFEHRALVALSNVDAEAWERIAAAPDDAFLKLERACRRDNDAELISSGVYFLRRHAQERLVDGFVQETAALLKAARILGGLGTSVRREALKRWTSHPLMIDGLPVEDLVQAVPKALDDVVPRKLKRRTSTLTPGQREWGARRLARSLPNLRWRLLAHLCLEELKVQVKAPARNEKELHALRLYGNIDGNRRALRKFLQAHFAGNDDYLLTHPLNWSWLRRQRMKRSVWLDGMTMDAETEDGAPLKLYIELDPLEALRLGTYVGSCTGVGGRFAYSAAAVVLDLNKHVVYARNAAGTVVGRQLLAVSEDGELVAFQVYPVGASDDLKRLFRDFDVEFARRLGISIHKPEGDLPGVVEPLLSKDWWDDGAWDLA